MEEKVQKAISSITASGKYVRGKLSRVPRLPYLPFDLWKQYAVPAIIENGGLPKSELVPGKEYLGFIGDANEVGLINGVHYPGVHLRDTNVVWAYWTGHAFVYTYSFIGWQQHGEIPHFEDSSGPSVFVPCFTH